ncbi:hypothetical protein ACFQS2_12780 [Brachybacterium sp. GCM10030267]|uniref:hypothetical protein n=1 Tax=unclassified Brachybacterium TaxID=2623841 RepID=UPI0036243A2C
MTILAFLIVIIGRLLVRRNRDREEAEAAGFPGGERPRTDEERAQDRRTAVVWGCAALAVPCLLVLAYVVTR